MSSHELDAPPWLRVESTIMATARAIRQSYDQRFNDLDLNLSEASVLAYVAEHGALSQTQIAKSLGLGRAATGALIDVLEWPVPKASYSLSFLEGKGARPPLALMVLSLSLLPVRIL